MPVTGVNLPSAGNGAKVILDPSKEAAVVKLTDALALRARQLELGLDPATKEFRAGEGAAGVRIEQTLGRQITRSSDPAADFVDSALGPISLKGPLPSNGNVDGLAASVVKDAKYSTSANVIFVDLTGLSTQQASAVKAKIEAGTAGTIKRIFYLP